LTRGLLGILALAVICAGLFVTVVSDSSRMVGKSFPGFLIWDNGMLVAFHGEDWTGIQAGLPTYGRVLSVDGEPFSNRAALIETASRFTVGTPIRYSIMQRGSISEITVPTMNLGLGSYFGTFAIYLFCGAICVMTALAVLYLKRDALDARALSAMLFAIGGVLLLAVDFFGTSRFGRVLPVMEAMTPIAILNFIAIFPSQRLNKRLARILLTMGFATSVAYGVITASRFYSDPEFYWRLTALTYIGVAAALVLALVMLGRSLASEASGAQRVRAAVVFAGVLSSCLLPAVAVPAFFLLRWNVSWSLIFTPIFFFPLAILYAVIRHDLFEAERFIRLSLGYSIASALATLLYSIILFVLDRTVFPDLATNPVSSLLFVLVLVVSFNPFRERTQHALDRYFYRTVINPGRVLENLSADLADCDDERAIRERVEEQLTSALNLEWVKLAHNATEATPADAQLTCPVTFRSEILSVLSCGSKLSGAPFAAADRDLLLGAASQTGIAIRNVQSMEALRDAQGELLRKERLATMGELAGSVAHGVRNPLSGIRASAQMARSQTDDSAVKETLTSIISESDRLEHRVRALLDFSRPFQPTIAAVEVAPILESVRRSIEPQAQRVGVEIEISAEPEGGSAACDANFLEEALLELAGNAIRIMGEAGGGHLRLSTGPSDDQIWIRVADDGPGIPENMHSRVFDLFFTTRSDGTGMGLAVVKRIFDAIGGTISVSSELGGGATFEISLPLVARPINRLA
jgi:signal transduction histidine kinase